MLLKNITVDPIKNRLLNNDTHQNIIIFMKNV